MADLTSQLFATAFPAAAQQSNLLPTGSGGGGRGGGAGGGGRGGVGLIGTSGGGGAFGQQPPFDQRGLPQQQQGGSSSYGGGRAGGEGAAGGGGGGGGGVEGRIDLSGYRRVAKPKPVPADESEIIVSNSGNIRVYVENATELLTQGPPLLPAGGGGSAAAAGEQQGAAARGEGNLQRKPPLDRIFIKGASQAMANAILVAEGVRRAVPDLHMIVQAHAEEVLDDWVLTPAAEEERRVAERQQRDELLPPTLQVPRTIHHLVLVLTKNVGDDELADVGYQAPLAPGYSSSADFLQDAEKRGFPGRRGGRGGGRRGRGRGGHEWGRSWRGGYRGGRGRGRRGRGGDFVGNSMGGAKREDVADF